MLRNLTLPATAALAALTAFAAPASAQSVLADYGPPLMGIDDAELTPDGRYIVARDNTYSSTAIVYDAATGAEVFRYEATMDQIGGTCQDAVAVTNERAIVIGSKVMIFDLTGPVPSLLAEHGAGFRSRDVAVTPDGTIAAVRGGEGGGGGQYLYDLASGAQIGFHAGEPKQWSANEFEVDSVVASDDHAVFTNDNMGNTRVTIWDLHPPAGPPVVVYETTNATDQPAAPHDIAITPNGRFAAVRSDDAIGLYRLDGANSTRLWLQSPSSSFEGFGGSAMDSIEVTDQRVATISRRRGAAGTGAYLDVFTIPGLHKFQLLDGDPHDLTITPNGQRLLVRTHLKVYLFDIRKIPAIPFLVPLGEEAFAGGYTSWSAGLDSIVATDDRVVAVSRVATSADTRLRVWDISQDTLDKVYSTKLDQEVVTDLEITPDGTRTVIAGWSGAFVLDMRSLKLTLQHDVGNGGSFPWCDGVATNDDTATMFGLRAPNSEQGWITIVDLFSQPTNYCVSNPNSTGETATIFVTGSASVGSNDLAVWAQGTVPNEFGQFFYGDMTAQNPFGDGFVCISGQVARFSVQQTTAKGLAKLAVDNTNLPMGGGAIIVGSSWNFQFVYRDSGSATGFNLTDAITIDFVN